MEISYFKSAWSDIKHTPNWLSKMMKLALLNLIPIFGQIVTFGYLYGWARDIAWGVHQPLPDRIFSNEDGKLYRRGFFALVVAFVISLLPELISLLGDFLTGGGALGVGMGSTAAYARHSVWGSVMLVAGALIQLLAIVASFTAYVLTPVGIVRMAIYDRLSAGLQIGRIWKMLRHDPHGALRIVGMTVLAGLVATFVVGAIGTLIASMCAVSFYAATGAGVVGASGAGSELLYGFGGLSVVLLLALAYLAIVLAVWVNSLTIRAVGYWVFQFDVPDWRGQDDPMPFEQSV